MDIDQSILSELQEHAFQLRAQHAERDKLFSQYEEMYLLNWAREASRKLGNKQITTSPDFRNQVQGAVRLMVATDPQINIERTEKTKDINVSKVESFLKTVLYQSGRLATEPVHYPLITAGLLYDEFHAAITATSDMLEYIKKKAKEEKGDTPKAKYIRANIERWEEIADTTPFMIEPWNPSGGYPEFAPTGLTAYYRITKTTVGEVYNRFGHCPGAEGRTRNTPVELHTFFDAVYTAVWVDGSGGGLLLREHGLPRIPVVAQILNGSRLFENPEDQRQPFGYTMLKSGLWKAQNLALTAMFTAVFNEAFTPTKVYTPQAEGSQINIDHDEDIITLHPGDRLDFVQNKGLIDPGLRDAYQLAEAKGNASTIYPQALGEAAEGRATYSEVSLLQQSGRLPLVGPQRRGGWGMSAICETILAMMRATPRYRKGTDLTAADMPRGIEVLTKLDVSLPQDKLQQANIFNILTDPKNPKVSNAWGLENILNINDPEKMRRDIWNERSTEQFYQLTVGNLLQVAQQQMQKKQMEEAEAQAQKQGQGGAAGQPGQAQSQAYAEGGAQPGAGQPSPVQGGMPAAQAGIVPGAGQGQAPAPERVR